MKIKKFLFDNSRWDRFCLESNDCWFYHTSDWIRYTLEYGGEESKLISFFIEDGNNDIIAICPLIRFKNKFVFSGSNGPNPALRNGISADLSKKLLNQIFSEIDSLASQEGIDECLMSLTSLAKNHLGLFTYNYLMKYNFENISLNTQIIDLDKDERTLWRDIKKSNRFEIKKGNNLFKFSIVKPLSYKSREFEEFKKLHFLAAGRLTRSEKSWEIQYDWITKGNGIVILAYLDEKPIGGIYTILYKDGGYYGISANHPDYEQYSISHAIQWKMIKWLKGNRYKYYELGIQQFSAQNYDHPTEKDIQISLFKRHFGGKTITFHRGIKKFGEKNKLI